MPRSQTHGLRTYVLILDDVTPLHQLSDKVASAPAHVFAPRDAIRTPARGGFGRGSGIQYPFSGATLDYYLAAAPASDVTIDVLDASGKVVRKFSSAASGAGERPEGADALVADDE